MLHMICSISHVLNDSFCAVFHYMTALLYLVPSPEIITDASL